MANLIQQLESGVFNDPIALDIAQRQASLLGEAADKDDRVTTNIGSNLAKMFGKKVPTTDKKGEKDKKVTTNPYVQTMSDHEKFDTGLEYADKKVYLNNDPNSPYSRPYHLVQKGGKGPLVEEYFDDEDFIKYQEEIGAVVKGGNITKQIGGQTATYTGKGDTGWEYLPSEIAGTGGSGVFEAEGMKHEDYGNVVGEINIGGQMYEVFPDGLHSVQKGNAPMTLTGDMDKDAELTQNWLKENTEQFVKFDDADAMRTLLGEDNYGSLLEAAQKRGEYKSRRQGTEFQTDILDLEELVYGGQFSPKTGLAGVKTPKIYQDRISTSASQYLTSIQEALKNQQE